MTPRAATLGMTPASPASRLGGRGLALVAEVLLVGAMAVGAVLAVLTGDGGNARGGALLDRRNLTLVFDEGFVRAPSFYDPATKPDGRWKTSYWFGVQETGKPKGWEPRTLSPNGELQYYGDPALGMSAFEWKPGMLTIAARPNRFADNPVTNGLPYLSGLITTEKSFALTYGYFEARVAFPSQKGIWPAFWLLPVPRKEGGQFQNPGTTEIDVFESIGEKGKLYFTYFPDLPGGQKKGDGLPLQTGLDLSQFHTYGTLVTPKQLIWYLDGREVRRAPNKDYHRPLYMLLNLAVGGNWPGKPDATTQWPARMRIDWVRAYRLKTP